MASYVNSITGNTVERSGIKNEEYLYTGKPMIVETDRERNITYANRRFVENSGYLKEEIIGAPHCMHMHPEMPAAIFQDACKMNDEGKTWHGLIQNINKEGISYWTDMTIQPKMNEMGRITGYLATRREMEGVDLAEVKAEYVKMKEEGSPTVRSQFCGEVYLGEGACAF